MAWIERIEQRTRRNKVFQDDANPEKFALDAHLGALHYEGTLDSGVFDTEINATPVRVNNAALDGWRIPQNGWHYAIGKPKEGIFNQQDGVIGFGGRQGAHWFKFRLLRAGYMKWSTREWGAIGGEPTYNRANLTSEVHNLTVNTTGAQLPIESIARWSDIWPDLPAGQVDASWRVNGDQLKEEITITQAAREWIAASRPPSYYFPGISLDDAFFGFVFRLDWSDIPRIYRAGILKSIEDDYADDGEQVEFRDALDRLLAFMPLDDVIVRDAEGNETRQPLRKRFYKDTDNNYYLLVGVRCDNLAGMPAGDLIFDPTIDAQVGASADDAYEQTSGSCNPTRVGVLINEPSEYFAARWSASVPAGATIDVAYFQVYNTTASRPFEYDIYVEDADSAAVYTTDDNNISGRSYQTLVDWSAGSQSDGFITSPSIATPVQATIDRVGWSSGNYLAIAFDETTGETAAGVISSYDDGSAFAPKLHIEYTAGGITEEIGLTTETDTPQALTSAKSKALSLETESDTPLALVTAKTLAIGLAAETETPLALSALKSRTLGLATESDTPQAISATKVKAIGLATETGTVLAVTVVKSRAIGLAAETDTAQALTSTKAKVIGLATETDTPLSVSSGGVAIGLATETDTPLGLTAVKTKAIGLAAEADTVLSLTAAKSRSIGLTTEGDAALALAAAKARAIGLAAETDTPLAITAAGATIIGLATETDTPLGMTVVKTTPLGLVTEADTPLAMTVVKSHTLGIVTETDTTLALAMLKMYALGLLVESDVPLEVSQLGEYGQYKNHEVFAVLRDKRVFAYYRNTSIYVPYRYKATQVPPQRKP